MPPTIEYSTGAAVTAEELTAFYTRINHDIAAQPDQIRKMIEESAVSVVARQDGELVGIARGISDVLRGYLTECKLVPECQGPAAVTKKDGRIEHDSHGIAAEMARRVIEELCNRGAQRIDVVAWNTEMDFLADLGFKKQGGFVGMTLNPAHCSAASAPAAS